MSFHNETMHPSTKGLMATLMEGPDSYECLETWRKVEDLSDERVAALYARIEEAFDSRPIDSLRIEEAASIVSGLLWENEVVA